MNKFLLASLIAGCLVISGCDDKKADTSAVDKAKDTMNAAKDKAAGAVDAAKDKAAQTMEAAKTKAMDEVKTMVDAAKAKLDSLTKGGASLSADKKPDFDKSMTDLDGQFKSLNDGFASLKTLKAEDITKKLGDLKTMGTKLMDGIKATADKYGIKI